MDTLLHEQGSRAHTLYPNRNPLPPWRRALPPAAVAQGVCRRGGVIKGYVGAERDHSPPPPGVSPLALTPTPYIIGAQKFLKF